MDYFRKPPQNDNKKYPLTITAETKDKILNAILVAANGQKTACLYYKDVPELEISKDQFEMVIKEFKDKKLISYVGYGNNNITLNSEIFNFYEKGGFTVERDLYTISFDVLELQLKRLDKELSPSTATKVNNIIAKAKNLGDLIIGFKEIIEMLKV